jgi:hypothetical protein
MTRRQLLSRGRSIIVISAFACAAGVGPAWAQRTQAEMDRAVTDLQTRVDTLQRDAARPPVAPLTPDAWKTLGGIAAIFMAAWAFVNLLREGTRRREMMLNTVAALAQARVKLREATSQEEINRDLDTRLTELQDLLVANAGGSLSLSLVLRRLFRGKKS